MLLFAATWSVLGRSHPAVLVRDPEVLVLGLAAHRRPPSCMFLMFCCCSTAEADDCIISSACLQLLQKPINHHHRLSQLCSSSSSRETPVGRVWVGTALLHGAKATMTPEASWDVDATFHSVWRRNGLHWFKLSEYRSNVSVSDGEYRVKCKKKSVSSWSSAASGPHAWCLGHELNTSTCLES